MALLVHQIPVGGFDDNFSYLIYDYETTDGVVVDPTGDTNLIFAAVQDLHITVTAMYITHTHFDHIDGIPAIRAQYGEVPIYVHELGQTALKEHKNVHTITDHENLALAGHSITVLHTPGHIDDAVCYFIAADAAHSGKPKLISGDTLFVGGCGRTTETRVKDLYESLQELKHLPGDTYVYPGHDYGSTPTATIAEECATNKYLLATDFNAFRKLRLS